MAEFDVDAELVRRLAALLEETGLGEIEFEADGRRVRVARPSGGIAVAAVPPPIAPVPAAAGAGGASGDQPLRPGTVTSPMVGTVYLSAAPDEPRFANVGDQVEAGQTLMLVEAMKTFNEITAPQAGRLSALLVENGQPVEFGEALAVVD